MGGIQRRPLAGSIGRLVGGRSGAWQQEAMSGSGEAGQVEGPGGAARQTPTETVSSPAARKRRRRRPDVAAGGRGGRRRRLRGEELTYCSDTMLGIDKLYSLGAKGHNI
jgi:hypothetical protein